MFSWKPTYDQKGSYTVTFKVSDGTLTDSETVAIAVGNVNQAPELEAIGNQSVDENSLLSFTVSATDPDEDELTYSATGLPTGATFSGQVFSWKPTYDQKGSYTVTFTVSDGTLTDSETIGIAVGNVNQAPELEAIGDQSVNENSLLRFAVSATDPDEDELTYAGDGSADGGDVCRGQFQLDADVRPGGLVHGDVQG